MDHGQARELVAGFVAAFHAAAGSEDLSPIASVATDEAQASFLVESHSATRMPLASRAAVPAGARLEVDLDRIELPEPGTIVTRFTGHGFTRPDFTGEVTLRVRDGKVAGVHFDAP